MSDYQVSKEDVVVIKRELQGKMYQVRFLEKDGEVLVCARDMVKLLHLPDDAAYRYCKHAVRCNVNHIVYNYLPEMDVDKLVEVSKHENRHEAGEFLDKGYARFSKTACTEVCTEANDQTRVECSGDMVIFENEKFGRVRTIEEDGKILFCGADVAKALGYARPNDAVSAHCRATVKRRITDRLGRCQEASFIPEGDVYRLIVRSKLPEAERFESWVFDDVLPSVRKKGYDPLSIGNPPDLAKKILPAPVPNSNNAYQNIEGMDCYEKDGIAYLRLETVAWGLGFTQTQYKNGKEYASVRWERVEKCLAEFGFPHKWGREDFIPENIFYRLAMKAKNKTAIQFQEWVANEVLPTLRKKGYYINPTHKTGYTSVPGAVVSQEFISGAHNFVLKAAQVMADKDGVYSGMILNQIYDILVDRWGIDLRSRRDVLEEAALANGEEKKVYLIRTIKPNEWIKVLRTVTVSLLAFGLDIDKVNQTEGFMKEKILDYDLKTLGEEELALQMSQEV